MSDPHRPDGLPATLRRVLHPRLTRGRLAVAALCALLGFALVAQVHSNRVTSGLGAARPQDLVGLLADLQTRATRLDQQIASLEVTHQQLAGASGNGAAAVAAARRQLQTLAILAGTVPATGPGVRVVVTDPRLKVSADVLFGLLEELRDGGAEVIQFGPVRVVASTSVTDDPGVGVIVDGRVVAPPYPILAIGDPRSLTGSLTIAGGIADTVDQRPGAHVTISPAAALVIRALRPLTPAG